MKAILVMEMADNCLGCPLLNGSDECAMQSEDANFGADTLSDLGNGCPLVPIPEKKEELPFKECMKKPHKSGFIDGWNACLDAIEGSKE